MIDLIEAGVVTDRHKRLKTGKTVFTFAMGQKSVYDFHDDNPCVESHPVDYVNDPHIPYATPLLRLAAFSGYCGLLDKIASDVKVMMMTELNEVQEPSGGGGRGASSTIPQKRNPISCAYITA